MSEYDGSHRSVSWFSFLCGFGFLVGLVNRFPRGAGWESVPLRSSRARVSQSIDTAVVGEVDDLEEDVG